MAALSGAWFQTPPGASCTLFKFYRSGEHLFERQQELLWVPLSHSWPILRQFSACVTQPKEPKDSQLSQMTDMIFRIHRILSLLLFAKGSKIGLLFRQMHAAPFTASYPGANGELVPTFDQPFASFAQRCDRTSEKKHQISGNIHIRNER